MIPEHYDAWRHCIEVDCGIVLTPLYINERLQALGDTRDFRTAQFTKLYGLEHLQRVRGWFEQALREVAP